MNIIFGLIITVSVCVLSIAAPEQVLSAMLSGGEKAMTLTLKLTVIYAVWLGISELMKRTGVADGLSKLMKPVNRFLFGKVPDGAQNFISLNLSANLLGMSGATTPMGIKAVAELEKYSDTSYAIAMFFVINATSIQLVPSSVLALRNSFSSASPSDIILPTILATTVSTIIGVIGVKLFVRKKPKKAEK